MDHHLLAAMDRPLLRELRGIGLRERSLLRSDARIVHREQLGGGAHRGYHLVRADLHRVGGQNRDAAIRKFGDVRRELGNRERVLVGAPVAMRVGKSFEHAAGRGMLGLEIAVHHFYRRIE